MDPSARSEYMAMILAKTSSSTSGLHVILSLLAQSGVISLLFLWQSGLVTALVKHLKTKHSKIQFLFTTHTHPIKVYSRLLFYIAILETIDIHTDSWKSCETPIHQCDGCSQA